MIRSSWPSERSSVKVQTPATVPIDAAAQQHQRQRRIDGAAAPVGQRAGERRGGDVAGDRGDGDRRRDADEDQQRRHQEAAADPEHAGHEADRRPHRQDEEDVDRNVGDRKVELHARSLRLWL